MPSTSTTTTWSFAFGFPSLPRHLTAATLLCFSPPSPTSSLAAAALPDHRRLLRVTGRSGHGDELQTRPGCGPRGRARPQVPRGSTAAPPLFLATSSVRLRVSHAAPLLSSPLLWLRRRSPSTTTRGAGPLRPRPARRNASSVIITRAAAPPD
jgi:hypothetical protein